MKSRFVLLALLGGLLALVVWVSAQAVPAPPVFRGSAVEPPLMMGDFALVDQTGKPFRLSERHGRIVLLYFGYTRCPDVCPQTLSELVRVREQLAEQADRVDFVMITADPDNDTPERLRDYLAHFDPSFYGLSGDQATLEPVWKAYGVYRAAEDAAGQVDHGSYLYALDGEGQVRVLYSFGVQAADIVHDVQLLLR